MKLTGDQFLVKEINKTFVLEAIRNHSPLSRSEVCKMTGLNKGTVARLVNDLIDINLISEVGLGKSAGGRKPGMLLFNSLAGVAIGIEVRIDKISAIMTDLKGEVLKRKEVFLGDYFVDYIYQKLKKLLQTLISEAPKCEFGVVGVGIGFPGVINNEGTVLTAPNLQWKNVPLRDMLQEDFDLPIVIDNEARVGAQGEKNFGLGHDINNMIYVSIGQGIGTGIILNKELYKGHLGFSGEAGHTTIDVSDESKSGKEMGIWQSYASVKTLLAKTAQLDGIQEKLDRLNKKEPDMDFIVALANEQNKEVIELLTNTGKYIGIGISNLIYVLSPELVVISGEMAKAESWLKDPIVQAAKERAGCYYEKELHIEFSHLGHDSILLGASSLAISQIFKKTQVTIN